MLRGKSNVNILAVMPLVACATPSAAIAPCALAQGKTQLAGLALRTLCGVPWAAQRTGPPVPSRPVLIPFLRTVYSVVQFRNPWTNPGGRDIGGLQLHVCS